MLIQSSECNDKTNCQVLNVTTPSLTAFKEVLNVPIIIALNLDTKFFILAFYVFPPNMPVQITAAA